MSEQFISTEWYRVAGVAPRLRKDLEVARHSYLGEVWMVLCNATSRKVHRLTPEAYAIAGQFNGTVTLDELWQAAQARLGADAPTHQDILTLLSQLHQADLLYNKETPLLDDVLERRDKERKQFWKKLLLNPLSATIPLINPDTFFARLARVFSFLSPAAWWLLGLAIICTALFSLPVHWSALTDRGFEGFLDLENLILIAAIYPVVKSLHEMGHGIATRARGGEVPEIGVMLIAFFPIPYVEASSALMFPSKWSRAAVAASGIMIELVIASFALGVWVMTDPGTLRTIAFNTMLVSGFSTLVVNGNPLLKFDGYHALSDIIEVPNLAQRGTKWWGEMLRNRVLGTRERRRFALSRWERGWFFVYTPAALVYRIGISLTIALFVATTYRFVGIILAVWSLTISLAWPFAKTLKTTFTDQRIRLAGARAWRGAVLSLGAIVIAVGFVPLPHFIVVQGVVWLPDTAFLRAPENGLVTDQMLPQAGVVKPGQTVFEIDGSELQAAMSQTEAKLVATQLALARGRLEDRARVQQLEQDLTALRLELAEITQRVNSLTVTTKHAGRIEIAQGVDFRGRYVAKGTLLAHVLPDDTPVVRAAIPQRDIRLLEGAQAQVDIRFAMSPFTTHPARILREVPQGAAQLPSAVLSLEGGGPFATLGGNDPLQTTTQIFVVDLQLDPREARNSFGMRAYIRFALEPTPLLSRVWRALRQRFLEEFDV